MMEQSRVLAIVECLYDAALNPGLWPEALGRVTSFVGGRSANVFWQDAATSSSLVLHAFNSDPHYDRLYFETYALLNPYFPALAFVEVGKVVAGADLIPHDEFRETRFFQEWVRPQGLIDVIGVNLERTLTSTAFFSIHRGEEHGVVDDGARARCELIAPHLKRAVAIGKTVQAGRAAERTLKRTMEQFEAAVFFVKSCGTIVYMNDRADGLVRAKSVVQVRNGVIAVPDAAVDGVLKDAFRAADRGDASLGLKGIDVALTLDGEDYFVGQVVSLNSSARGRDSPDEAVAALFVRRMTKGKASPLDLIRQRYRLTPSELRVVAAVLETGSVDEIAGRLGISKATVKTHLNHVMAKTGAKRQADLIRLVLGGAPGQASG